MKKVVNVGGVKIGGDNRVSIQSMTNTDTRNVDATVEQIARLEDAGCEIVRLAVLDNQAAEAIGEIKKRTRIPLVADIHFDYRLALTAIENGIDKVRINPGNIGDKQRVEEVVNACKLRGIPIRIGVNGGSLEKNLLEKYGAPTPEALVESALGHIEILDELNFEDIVVSIKTSSVPNMIQAYHKLDSITDYPLHVGVTESGTVNSGIIKSSVGIGALLSEGIGNTIRVSLTADPVKEIEVAHGILKSLGLRNDGVTFISCPTCGRTQIDLISIANEVEKRIDTQKPITVAVMGCVVNGPGEAKEADIGIAGGKGEGIIFKKGVIVKKVPEENIVDELLEEIKKL